MIFRNLILQNRSYRRFDESTTVSETVLTELVDYARFSPIGMNRQSLRYYIANASEEREKIFSTLAWAGALKEWSGPEQGERPAAYIVILLDKEMSQGAGINPGIAAQSILLGAVEKGLGGCMLGAVNRRKLTELLELPEKYAIELVIALGKPAEKVVLEEAEGEDTTYYRDADDVHHVPKYPLDRLILKRGSQKG